MSATSVAPVRTAAMVPGAPALPQVNLLPPEITAGRRLGRLKAWLGVAILVSIFLAGLLLLWATFSARQAQAELSDVEAVNQGLLAEQAEYAEVPRVLNQLSEALTARRLGMSTEVRWRPYLAALAATSPTAVSFDTFSVVAATPTMAPVGAAHPLQGPNVGTLTFTARSVTVPDTAAWLDNLDAVTGFSDPWISSSQVTEDEGVYFIVSGSVQITEDAYAQRFIDIDEES
ncbi:PilN domain-containing protein [Actinotalea sp. K2]|uniref:PilN domain-containing protein n=1 Tax=Actinotalea sp. K2 TaxID=2939438 RepID=UPI002017EF19|nr:fimbrial assembly protein [Actinotalea sp. K2]MCL3862844.1 fimbrial assembly protein [Actinotalea sp. K2]